MATIRRVKSAFIKRKWAELSYSNDTKIIWSLNKSTSNSLVPPLIMSDNSIANLSLHKSLPSATFLGIIQPCPNPIPLLLLTPHFEILSLHLYFQLLESMAFNRSWMLLRCLAQMVFHLVFCFFDCSVSFSRQQFFSKSCKHFLVQPSFMSEDHSKPSNYHPISIKFTISNVIETIR